MLILIVENDPAQRHMLRRIVEQEGHVVIEAQGPLDAMQMISQYHPPIYLIDYELGSSLTGLDVAKHARKDRSDAALIMVTGHDVDKMRPVIEDPLQAFLAVVGKPTNGRILIHHIRRAAALFKDTDPHLKKPTIP